MQLEELTGRGCVGRRSGLVTRRKVLAAGTPIAVNFELLDRAGLRLPAANWTWENLTDYAVKLTLGSGGETNQWDYATAHVGDFAASNDFNTFLHSFGGQWTDSTGPCAARRCVLQCTAVRPYNGPAYTPSTHNRWPDVGETPVNLLYGQPAEWSGRSPPRRDRRVQRRPANTTQEQPHDDKERRTRSEALNEEEMYLFETHGYLLIRSVLGAGELAALNELLDEQKVAETGKKGFGGFLLWGQPFRNLLDHPRILPHLKELLDPGPRLDHYYGIYMRDGTPGLRLHGGGTPYDRPEYYHYRNGQMYNGLTVVSWALTDVPADQGGFICIPGSHKANYPCPEPIRTLQHNPGCVIQVPMRAGDVVIFTEALTHGTQPWTAPTDRRALLYKYSPGHMAWGSDYTSWPAELLELLTPDQRLLLEPPYHARRKNIGETEAPAKGAYT